MSQKTTFTDPRLAFAVEDKDIVGDISSLRQKFDSHSTAMQVLVGRDLSGKFCIITGANSGIGRLTRFQFVHQAYINGLSIRALLL